MTEQVTVDVDRIRTIKAMFTLDTYDYRRSKIDSSDMVDMIKHNIIYELASLIGDYVTIDTKHDSHVSQYTGTINVLLTPNQIRPITCSDINTVRSHGYGMYESKHALEEANGDIKGALRILEKRRYC